CRRRDRALGRRRAHRRDRGAERHDPRSARLRPAGRGVAGWRCTGRGERDERTARGAGRSSRDRRGGTGAARTSGRSGGTRRERAAARRGALQLAGNRGALRRDLRAGGAVTIATSVVVPTLDDPTLADTLRALGAEVAGRDDVEVVVAGIDTRCAHAV